MKSIKKYIPRIISGALALTVMCSGIAFASYSKGAEDVVKQVSAVYPMAKADSDGKTVKAGEKLSKNETVYVIADADGTPSKVIVSDWIKNPSSVKKFSDVSALKDIKNVKGSETYTINENNVYQWNADGNDIYYQGIGSEPLPVGLNISYTLDGKEISSEQLVGKSGKVKLRFDYENRKYKSVKIDGRNEKIYVPFVMLTGMALDNSVFKNIEISNGKLINDGNRTFAAGFAFPGMQENLNIDKEDFELPSNLEITADVTSFKLPTTLTLAANDMFSDIDFSKADEKIDTLSDSLSDMTEAVDKLIDGSSKLYEGVSTLLDKSGELIEGVNKLYDGADKINKGSGELNKGAKDLASGAAQLDSGVGALQKGAVQLDGGAGSLNDGAAQVNEGVAQLQGYISQLCGGLDSIAQNSESLRAGAEQIFNTLLATADAQIAAAGITAPKLTIENYDKVLDELAASLDETAVRKIAEKKALETVTATVNSQKDVIRTAVEAQTRKAVTEKVLAAAGLQMSADEYENAVAAGQISEEIQIKVSTAVSAQMNSAEVQAMIDSNTNAKIESLIEENMQSEAVQTMINEAVKNADAGKKALAALKKQLDNYNVFYQGIIAYTDGVGKANSAAKSIFEGTGTLKNGTGALASGATDLKSGTANLRNGTNDLKNGSSALAGGANKLYGGAAALEKGSKDLFGGMAELKNGGGALTEGVKKLKDGSMTLTDGLKKFKKEGVNALVKAVDGDVKGLVNRLKAVSRVSAEYKSYSGISDDMNGKVDFIFKTDSIGEDK